MLGKEKGIMRKAVRLINRRIIIVSLSFQKRNKRYCDVLQTKRRSEGTSAHRRQAAGSSWTWNGTPPIPSDRGAHIPKKPWPHPYYRRCGYLSYRSLAERSRQEDIRLLQTGNTCNRRYGLTVRFIITPLFRFPFATQGRTRKAVFFFSGIGQEPPMIW